MDFHMPLADIPTYQNTLMIMNDINSLLNMTRCQTIKNILILKTKQKIMKFIMLLNITLQKASIIYQH
jgi:hypothetical protein